MFWLSILAYAMFVMGIFLLLMFLNGMYSISFVFPSSACLMFFNLTFTITAPSFRCKLTFLPMYDFAMFTLKCSMLFTILCLGLRFCSSSVRIWG